MTNVTCVVEAVSTKWEKFSAKVGEQWYSNKEEFYADDVKKNGGTGIQVGDTISFSSGKTGKYLSGWKIVSGGAGSVVGPATTKATGGGYSQVGVAVGAAMNQAVALHGPILDGEVDTNMIEQTAMDLYELAERLKAQASAGNIRVSKEEKEAAEEALKALEKPFAD